MQINKQLLKGCTKTIVLQLLSKKNMHGYELSVQLKTLSAGKVEVTEGTLYPLLHSLEADGAISSTIIEQGKRTRKVYVITSEGKRLLKSKTEEWQEFQSMMEKLLAASRGLAI
jgi:PadR family transcriptional regulator, regulatory protein PadR